MGITLRIQQIAVQHRIRIIRVFQTLEIALVSFTTLASVKALIDPTRLPALFLVAPLFGKIAAFLLTITLLPGILGRFSLFPIPRATLMLFRRYLGILTYLMVVTHSMFIYWLPSFTYGFGPLRFFQLFGMLAATMATPLFLTSNDYSVRVLKKGWKRIHKLVYLMLIFALLHTLLIEVGVISLMLATVAVLEVLSFLVQYRHAHTTPRG